MAWLLLLGQMLGAWIADIKALFGGKSSSTSNPTADAVGLSNKTGKITGAATRDAENQSDAKQAQNNAETNDALADVRSTNSLQRNRATINDEIASANRDGSSHD